MDGTSWRIWYRLWGRGTKFLAWLVLVSSPHHTRRVTVIWSRVRESRSGIEGTTVAAGGTEIELDEWRGTRRAAEAVLHE